MRRRVVSRPRVDEKGGKNQFPRSGQLAAIHLPSHDLEISGISKERRICVQKTDGFTPLRPSLAFNPLFHQSPLFFSFFFFLHWIASSTLLFVFFPLFFPSSSFFFFFLFLRWKDYPKFPEKFSEHAGYASSASPFDFIPAPASLRDDLPKSGKNLPAYPVILLTTEFPRLSFSLFLSVLCGLKRVAEGRKKEKSQRQISPRTNAFSHSFYASFRRTLGRGGEGETIATSSGLVHDFSSRH